MEKICYDKNMIEIKYNDKITDGKTEYTVHRIARKLSISVDGDITPISRLRHNKINAHKVILKDYTVVK